MKIHGNKQGNRGWRWRRERKQRQGCTSGVMLRLRKQLYKPPLPSLYLANARSLVNKMDYLELQLAGNRYVQDCCLLIITETWLHPDIPDASMQLAGHTLLRWDRTKDFGKSRGGGLCVYVHDNWCNNGTIIEKHCSPDLEYMSVRCRPFFLPRELTVVIVTAVYIPPDANVNIALSLLLNTMNEQQWAHPDEPYPSLTSAGQTIFPSCSPQPTPPSFAAPGPLQNRIWPDNALFRLQDCFERTDWDMFKHQDLETFTGTVLDYIKFCIGNKPWMTSQVRRLLKAHDAAFRSGDRALYRAARADLKKGIKKAKTDHKRRLESHLSSNNTREVWQGIRDIINYRDCHVTTGDPSAPLAEELNSFFARFEKEQQQHSSAPALLPLQPPPSSGSCTTPLTVTEQDVRRVLLAVNPRKAAGPDGVPGKVLRACAPQLALIFTAISYLSLAQAVIPSCLKSAIIIPVPKKSPITSLNDYRPVALTPVIMKCFERLVLRHIREYLPSNFDPHQFAYRTKKSTEDAIALALHAVLGHLEQQQSYGRMLFVDYSSAFNTIIPDILFNKLDILGLPSLTCAWIKDFLTNRSQIVRLGPRLSSTRMLSIGSPQGCVLSPFLYCLYTHDCSASYGSGDEVAYREEVLKLATWCSENNLALNTKKTKEIIVDFRRHSTDLAPLYINGECVERVHTFRFLGVFISDNISWTVNTTAIIKKAQQRLYFLRVLRKHNLGSSLLLTFYCVSIESLLTYCITVWYGSCTMADRERLQRVVKAAQKIIGCPLPSLLDIYTSRCLSRAENIIKHSSHPASDLFNLLPSGRRYSIWFARLLPCRKDKLPHLKMLPILLQPAPGPCLPRMSPKVRPKPHLVAAAWSEQPRVAQDASAYPRLFRREPQHPPIDRANTSHSSDLHRGSACSPVSNWPLPPPIPAPPPVSFSSELTAQVSAWPHRLLDSAPPAATSNSELTAQASAWPHWPPFTAPPPVPVSSGLATQASLQLQ
ncbi:putative RNA-directed DNA polymerase from transposon BS [Labeo rohita]|uniref:RNA-directed DNA polymerase from transposon BS n=1 Tax=Labeo rohita TaxID=84645 RepID=A0ABQ8MA61_LABRO|nr:putative RNA-directed DNA polymerase from transposon BS [Labeo rohita]